MEDAKEPVGGDVEIKNLTFRYPETENNALSDISLHLPRGATLGVDVQSGTAVLGQPLDQQQPGGGHRHHRRKRTEFFIKLQASSPFNSF